MRRQLAVCKTLANADERVRVDAIDDERVSGLPPRTPSTRRVEEPPIPYEKSLAYRYFRTRPDDLAAPIVSAVGPALRFDRHIQSRVALTRPLARGVELEVVWETRHRIESGAPMAFSRQLVGAMIRVTP